ncbi:hypothetical protein ES705_09752 [subsurface metagenome]
MLIYKKHALGDKIFIRGGGHADKICTYKKFQIN